MPLHNPAIWTLADGTQVDTQNLPPGQKVCPYCMHLHDVADLYTGPVTPDHFRRIRRVRRTGKTFISNPADHPHLQPGFEYEVEEVTGDIDCVGCQGHGPHPEM